MSNKLTLYHNSKVNFKLNQSKVNHLTQPSLKQFVHHSFYLIINPKQT